MLYSTILRHLHDFMSETFKIEMSCSLMCPYFQCMCAYSRQAHDAVCTHAQHYTTYKGNVCIAWPMNPTNIVNQRLLCVY